MYTACITHKYMYMFKIHLRLIHITDSAALNYTKSRPTCLVRASANKLQQPHVCVYVTMNHNCQPTTTVNQPQPLVMYNVTIWVTTTRSN